MSAFLSPEQLQQFRRDGYLVLPAMVGAEARARMRAVVEAQLHDAVPPLEYEAEVGYPGAPDSLDAPGGRTVRRLKDEGISVLIVEQNALAALEVSDRVYVMDRGTIVHEGSAATLLADGALRNRLIGM